MAKSATGKWVSRVGASGGGKSYKKSRPGNYYGALAVIVILGLATTVLARYDYQHPAVAAASTPPSIGTTWYSAITVQACGEVLPFLNVDPNYKGGFTVQSANVIRLSPASAADSGSNATLSQFALEYPGMIASSTELAIPTSTGVTSPKTTYRNGETCPKGSKYAGRPGQISYASWKFGQKKPTITTDPSSIKFSQFLRVAMAFDPSGVIPQPPSQTSVDAMVKATQTVTTTTQVKIPAHKPSTTTTLKKGVTTTTAPKG